MSLKYFNIYAHYQVVLHFMDSVTCEVEQYSSGLTSASETSSFSSRTVPVVSFCEEQIGASVAPRVEQPYLALYCTLLTIPSLFTTYKKLTRPPKKTLTWKTYFDFKIAIFAKRWHFCRYAVCRIWWHLVVCLQIETNWPLLCSPLQGYRKWAEHYHPVYSEAILWQTLSFSKRIKLSIDYFSVILVCQMSDNTS